MLRQTEIDLILTTDSWVQTLKSFSGDLNEMGDMALNRIPYPLLQTTFSHIANTWDQWRPQIELATQKSIHSFEIFKEEVNQSEKIAVKHLLSIATTIHQVSFLDHLTNQRSFIHEREEADRDESRGFMRDICTKTLQELSQKIYESPTDWKLLADGLGFDNLECTQMGHPYELLQQWLIRCPDGTVARLCFEARHVEMDTVYRFLAAIPLGGASVIIPERVPLKELDILNRYQLEKLRKEYRLNLSWTHLAKFYCSSHLEQQPSSDPFTILWKFGPNLGQILTQLATQEEGEEIIHEIREDIRSGFFNSKSPGEVTLAQIYHLSGASSRMRRQSKGFQQLFYTGGFNLNVLYSNLPDGEKFKEKSFFHFLLIYWQCDQLGAHVTINRFCEKILEILTTSQNEWGQKACEEEMIDAFKEVYFEIKTQRSYDSLLDIQVHEQREAPPALSQDLASPVERTSRKAKNIFQNTFDENGDECTVCMDRIRSAVAIPCGHFGFCIECLQNLKVCPICFESIKDRVRVYLC